MVDRVDPSDERGKGALQEGGVAEAPVLTRGTSVGRYTVLEILGRGGMGAVYKAYDPELDRLIALKVISPQSSESESALQAHGRVMREAQALAQLSHPNVVAVYDVGKHAGTVYIAIELVEGKTGKEWLEEKRQSRKEILAVFRQAGEGLLAAHAAGLVHRDFKPANMILGYDGRVRVTDFGLVRSLSAQPPPQMEPVARSDTVQAREIPLTSGKYLSADLTQSQLVLGTPHYMSPEQLKGRAIDGRTDQYSFCVCLFEALYGERPFYGRNLDELIENVVDGCWKAPSAVAEVPEWLRIIVEKGLSREASDRYPSMRELLDALAADPEEAAQRARESRRRSLRYAGLGALLAALLVLAGVYMFRMMELCRGGEDLVRPIWNEEVKAKVREAFVATGRTYARDTYERVAGHLNRWAREWVAAYTEACEATVVKETQSEKILDLKMGCLERKLRSLQALVDLCKEKPDGQVVDRAVEAALGLGGLAFCADVKALEQEVAPPEKPEDRRMLAELRGRLEEVEQLDKLGKYREAEARLKEIAPQVEALGFPPLRAELAYHTGMNLQRLVKYAEAETAFLEALEVAIQSGMKDLAARAGSEVAFVVGYNLARYAEGLIHSFYTQNFARGQGDELETRSLNNRAIIYSGQGKYTEAEKLFKRVLAMQEKAIDPEHLYLARASNNLAAVYEIQRKYGEAEELYKKALANLENALGPEHPDVAKVLSNLAIVLNSQGKYVDAEELQKRALAIKEKALGPENPHVADSLTNLADVYHAQGKDREALEIQKRALAIREKVLGPDNPTVADSLTGLAATYEKQHRFTEAQALLERARAICEKADMAPKLRADIAFPLARVLWASGKDRARARSLAQEALTLYQATGPSFEAQRSEVEQWIAEHR